MRAGGTAAARPLPRPPADPPSLLTLPPGALLLCLRGLAAIRIVLRLRTWRPLCCGARVMTTGSLGVWAEGACCAYKALLCSLQ